jgi:hypothetical protein
VQSDERYMLDAGLYSLLVAPTTDGTIAFTDTSADLSVPSYEAKQGAEVRWSPHSSRAAHIVPAG